MCLNPIKFVFREEGRKYLGFMLTHSDIEANPDKSTIVLSMQSSTNLKEV